MKDDLIYAGHMLDMSRLAVTKLTGIERDQYDADENLRLALAHLLQIVGEAATHTSSGFREAHPEIPWAKVIGMRHRVVHDYLHIDYDIVWDVVRLNLPSLIEVLETIVL